MEKQFCWVYYPFVCVNTWLIHGVQQIWTQCFAISLSTCWQDRDCSLENADSEPPGMYILEGQSRFYETLYWENTNASSAWEEVRARRGKRRWRREKQREEEVIIPFVLLTHETSINSPNHFNNFMKQAPLSVVHKWRHYYYFFERLTDKKWPELESEPMLVWYLSDFLD